MRQLAGMSEGLLAGSAVKELWPGLIKRALDFAALLRAERTVLLEGTPLLSMPAVDVVVGWQFTISIYMGIAVFSIFHRYHGRDHSISSIIPWYNSITPWYSFTLWAAIVVKASRHGDLWFSRYQW